MLDIILLCFSTATGTLKWTRQNGTPLNDVGYSVAASADGMYVYVTGYASGSFNGQPFAGTIFNTYVIHTTDLLNTIYVCID